MATKAAPEQVTQADVIHAAQAAGVPQSHIGDFLAIVQQESGGHYDAYQNSAGAVGPAQKVGYPLPTNGEPLASWAQGNLLAGASTFASDLRSFPNNTDEAIAAYYTGAGNVSKYGISSAYGNPTPAQYVADVHGIESQGEKGLSYPVGDVFGTSPFPGLSSIFNSAGAAVSNPVTGAASSVGNTLSSLNPVSSVEGLIKWVTDVHHWEMLFGAVTIALGIVMVGRAAANQSPVKQTAQAAQTAAAPVTVIRERRATRQRAQAKQPLRQQPRRAQRRAGFTTADQQRRPRRGQPGSSQLARGEEIPF